MLDFDVPYLFEDSWACYPEQVLPIASPQQLAPPCKLQFPKSLRQNATLQINTTPQ